MTMEYQRLFDKMEKEKEQDNQGEEEEEERNGMIKLRRSPRCRIFFILEVGLVTLQVAAVVIDWNNSCDRRLNWWMMFAVCYRLGAFIFQWICIEPCLVYLRRDHEDNDFEDNEDENEEDSIVKTPETFKQYIDQHSSNAWVSSLCFGWVITWLWCLQNDWPLIMWTLVGTYWWTYSSQRCSQWHARLSSLVMLAVLALSYLLLFISIFNCLGKLLCRVPWTKSQTNKKDGSFLETTLEKENLNMVFSEENNPSTGSIPNAKTAIRVMSDPEFTISAELNPNTNLNPNSNLNSSNQHKDPPLSEGYTSIAPTNMTETTNSGVFLSAPDILQPYHVDSLAKRESRKSIKSSLVSSATMSPTPSQPFSVSNGIKRYVVNSSAENVTAMQRYLIQHKQKMKIDVREVISNQRLKCKHFELSHIPHPPPIDRARSTSDTLSHAVISALRSQNRRKRKSTKIEVTVNEIRTDTNLGLSPTAKDTAFLFEGDDYFFDESEEKRPITDDEAKEIDSQTSNVKTNNTSDEEKPIPHYDKPSYTETCRQLMDWFTGCSNLPTLTLLSQTCGPTINTNTIDREDSEARLLADDQNKHYDAKLNNNTNKNFQSKRKPLFFVTWLEPPLTRQAMTSMSKASILNRGSSKILDKPKPPLVRIRQRVSKEDIRDGGNTFCGLCLERYIDKELVIEISMCKHYFHQQCLLSWFTDYDECPFCHIKV